MIKNDKFIQYYKIVILTILRQIFFNDYCNNTDYKNKCIYMCHFIIKYDIKNTKWDLI